MSRANIPLVCSLLLAFLLHVVLARPPTFPRLVTGRISCMQPIKYLRCIRDSRTKFVAGVGTSYGLGFGVKNVCSDGGASTFQGPPQFQEVWDMSAPEEPGFPKDEFGNPDFRYFHPYGNPITQMIVLQASNPRGPKFGTIPAIIFGYLTTDKVRSVTVINGTATNVTTTKTRLDFAVCGNADYAMAYLFPGEYQLPPTMVTLQAVYTNPMSEERPPRFLGSFEGHCGLLGRGFLGGDPYTLSKNALQSTYKACFAPMATFVNFKAPQPEPLKRVISNFTPRDYQPCYYDKHNTKGPGTSWSCAMEGTAIATGKYGAINLNNQGQHVGWQRDQKTGRMEEVLQPELFTGTPGEVQAAPAESPP